MFKDYLQLFADAVDDVQPNEPTQNAVGDDQKQDDDGKKGKMFTQEEMEHIIQQRLLREKKAHEKAVKEAEKLAKMNEDEKRQFELEKLKEELEEYKRKEAVAELTAEAKKMFDAEEIPFDEKAISYLVKESAEETQEIVNNVINAVKQGIEDGVKKALSGQPPRKPKTNAPISKAEIMAIKDANERHRLMRENLHLFQN